MNQSSPFSSDGVEKFSSFDVNSTNFWLHTNVGVGIRQQALKVVNEPDLTAALTVYSYYKALVRYLRLC